LNTLPKDAAAEQGYFVRDSRNAVHH